MLTELQASGHQDLCDSAFWEWEAQVRFDTRMRRLYPAVQDEWCSLESWAESVALEDRQAFLDEFGQARREHRCLHVSVRMHLTLGVCRVILQASPLGDRWVGSQRISPQDPLVAQALYESKMRFASAFEFAGIGMALVSLTGRWTRVNRALCQIVGYSQSELLQLTFQDITHPDDLQADLDLVQDLLDGVFPSYQMEKRYLRKDGEEVWILLTASLVRTPEGFPLYFVAQIQDISERRRSQQFLVDSLLEKEALLHEIHHRVKNNLQVVNSILSLQSRSVHDAALKVVFEECQSRIHCMSMIHERLYQNNEFSKIDLHEHLKDLVELCARSRSRGLELHLETESVQVSLDTAIPVSLVANEVFSNCLKHHQGEVIHIWLRLAPRLEGGFELEIRDDGPGFPAGISEATSLGVKLIRRLSQQLRATIDFRNWEKGAHFVMVLDSSACGR